MDLGLKGRRALVMGASKGLGRSIANALAAQNILTPVGTQKIGELEYTIQLNSAPSAIEDLNRLPIKVVNGTTILMQDVANVHDGNAPQTNVVHVDGGRSVLMSVLAPEWEQHRGRP